ncbi:MAG: DUF2723 domain-containing protein [Candidatus Goldbacteria bacterium]|nr:DUF2723 domain-containing protein [Candidatus Goldiibacteriota bacterium]
MAVILSVISLILLFLFILTAPPTIYFGDSGELAAAAYNLGIGHPPGYPLFTLMEKLFSYLPAGDIAFRMNLMSGFFAVLVFIMLYFTVKEFISYAGLLRGKPAFKETGSVLNFTAVITSLIYVLSGIFWEVSLNIKGGIYTMAHFGYVLALYSLIRYLSTKKIKWFYFLAFTCGLLPVFHQTTLVLVIAVLSAALFAGRGKLKPGSIIASFFLLLTAAATPYLYLFIRHSPHSSVVWFEISTFTDIMNHIQRTAYLNAVSVPLSLNSAVLKTTLYIQQLFTQYNVFLIPVIIGFIAVFKNNKKLFFVSAGFILVNYCALIYFTDNTFSPVFIYVNRAFYLLNDIILIIIGGAGLYYAVNLLKEKQGINSVFSLSLVLVIPVIQLLSNFPANNHARKFFAYDHAVNIMKTLKPGDILFSKTDQPSFNIQYLHYVKNKYRDIKAYDVNGNVLDHSIYSHIPRRALTAQMQKGIETKIVLDNPGKVYNFDLMAYPEHDLYTAKYGIIGSVTLTGKSIPGDSAVMKLITLRDYFTGHKLDYFYRETIARYFCRLAQYAMRDNDGEKARMYLTEAEKAAPDAAVIIKLIASVYFYDARDLPATLSYLEKAVLMDPYDFQAIRLMVFIYSKAAPPAVPQMIKWLEYEYRHQSSAQRRAEIASKISVLKSGGMIDPR